MVIKAVPQGRSSIAVTRRGVHVLIVYTSNGADKERKFDFKSSAAMFIWHSSVSRRQKILVTLMGATTSPTPVPTAEIHFPSSARVTNFAPKLKYGASMSSAACANR